MSESLHRTHAPGEPARIPYAPSTAEPIIDGAAMVACGGRHNQFTFASVEERFWSKVAKTPTCWLWLGRLGDDGYGQFWLDGRHRQAHRFAYELLVGPIPEGLELDHVRERGCTNRHCVNPAHLEPVTHRVNGLRSGNIGAVNARKTHCSNGHEYTPGNTYSYSDGRRACRQCLRSSWNRAAARRRARRAIG